MSGATRSVCSTVRREVWTVPPVAGTKRPRSRRRPRGRSAPARRAAPSPRARAAPAFGVQGSGLRVEGVWLRVGGGGGGWRVEG